MTTTSDTSKGNGCTYYLIRFGIFLAGMYALQFVLQLILAPTITTGPLVDLAPFQNHYLALDRNFITNEGATHEFTDDTSAVGRFLTFLIPAFVVWFVILVIVHLIKPLRKCNTPIFWVITPLLFGILLYSEFFVPHRKTTFGKDELVVEQTHWVFSRKTAHLPYSAIERFEYDFLKERDVHVGKMLFAQIFAVAGGKRWLLGENQVPVKNDAQDPTDDQKQEAQRAVDAINKLTGKEL